MKNASLFTTSLLILLAMNFSAAQKGDAAMQKNEKENVKAVVEKAYIEGIHTTQDESTVRSGFFKDFAMLVYKDIRSRLLMGWLIGIVASLIGLYLSATCDFPTGAAIVCTLGLFVPIVVFLKWMARRRQIALPASPEGGVE